MKRHDFPRAGDDRLAEEGDRARVEDGGGEPREGAAREGDDPQPEDRDLEPVAARALQKR